jgi:hypothetical protein
MYRIARISLAVVVLAILAAAPGHAAPKRASKTPASKVTAPKVTAAKMPTGPKLLKVVAGQPFETVPATGSAKLATTMCAEQTAALTFTVRYSKVLSDIRVEAADLVGPGKIGRDNVKVRLVAGDRLVSADKAVFGPNPMQFWVDVTAPKGAKAGLYRGYIGFYSQGKPMDVVPIEVSVSALRLIGSSKQYALYTSLSPFGEGTSALSPEAYAAFLSAVAKMGFRAVAVTAGPTKIGEVLSACGTAGLTGGTPVLTFASGCTVPSIDDVRAVETASKSSGIPTLFQFCASNPANDCELSAAVDKCRILRQAGFQVAATVSDDATAQKLLPVCDAVNYRIDMPYVQALINGGGNRTNKWEWYWWDARQSVTENRINAGIGLWRSGLYGCMPFWMPKGSGDHPENLDSLLCEALSEGVTDTRYMTTYMKALRELKDKKRAGDKDYIASTETYLSAFLTKPLDKLTPADLRAFRAKMIEFSNKLASML